MELKFPNKCYGCQHYDGFNNFDGSRTMVRCDLGKSARISIGCGSFSPDITANCYRNCIYDNGGNCAKGVHRAAFKSVDYCHQFAYTDEESEPKKSKGGCFISTTVCDILNKEDNCNELETLRAFRDNKLLKNKVWSRLVDEYYIIAPPISEKINNSVNSKEISQKVMDKYIKKVLVAIEKGNDSKAIEIYENMIVFLREHFNIIK